MVIIAVYARIGTGYNFSVNKKMLCYCFAALSLKCDWISESSMRSLRLHPASSIPDTHVPPFFIATGHDAMLAESAADCEVYFYHSPPRSTEMLLSPHWHPDGQVYDA